MSANPVTDRYPPQVLREYALIADGQRGGLCGPRGDLCWLCVPRWHDDAVFSSLVGGAGVYAVTPVGRFVWGGYYEPGSLIWRNRWVGTEGIVECREALAVPAEPRRGTSPGAAASPSGPARSPWPPPRTWRCRPTARRTCPRTPARPPRTSGTWNGSPNTIGSNGCSSTARWTRPAVASARIPASPGAAPRRRRALPRRVSAAVPRSLTVVSCQRVGMRRSHTTAPATAGGDPRQATAHRRVRYGHRQPGAFQHLDGRPRHVRLEVVGERVGSQHHGPVVVRIGRRVPVAPPPLRSAARTAAAPVARPPPRAACRAAPAAAPAAAR